MSAISCLSCLSFIIGLVFSLPWLFLSVALGVFFVGTVDDFKFDFLLLIIFPYLFSFWACPWLLSWVVHEVVRAYQALRHGQVPVDDYQVVKSTATVETRSLSSGGYSETTTYYSEILYRCGSSLYRIVSRHSHVYTWCYLEERKKSLRVVKGKPRQYDFRWTDEDKALDARSRFVLAVLVLVVGFVIASLVMGLSLYVMLFAAGVGGPRLFVFLLVCSPTHVFLSTAVLLCMGFRIEDLLASPFEGPSDLQVTTIHIPSLDSETTITCGFEVDMESQTEIEIGLVGVQK